MEFNEFIKTLRQKFEEQSQALGAWWNIPEEKGWRKFKDPTTERNYWWHEVKLNVSGRILAFPLVALRGRLEAFSKRDGMGARTIYGVFGPQTETLLEAIVGAANFRAALRQLAAICQDLLGFVRIPSDLLGFARILYNSLGFARSPEIRFDSLGFTDSLGFVGGGIDEFGRIEFKCFLDSQGSEEHAAAIFQGFTVSRFQTSKP